MVALYMKHYEEGGHGTLYKARRWTSNQSSSNHLDNFRLFTPQSTRKDASLNTIEQRSLSKHSTRYVSSSLHLGLSALGHFKSVLWTFLFRRHNVQLLY